MRVGNTLREESESLCQTDSIGVVSGGSCKEQLESVLNRPVCHPLRLPV